MKKAITAFREFYPDYLKAHNNPTNISLHFIGATLFFICLFLAITWHIVFLPAGIFIGYLLPHIGHTQFQKNKSMRAEYPVFCVLGATRLYFDTWKRILGL